MRVYAIKTKKGYLDRLEDIGATLNQAALFITKKAAEKMIEPDENEKIIKVDIKVVK